jgi:hypothetical protein
VVGAFGKIGGSTDSGRYSSVVGHSTFIKDLP